MDFLQKLDVMIERSGLTKTTLSRKSGIPYTTIDAWYKKGYEGLKLTTLRKLASYFNTTLDYWFLSEITDPDYNKSFGFEVGYAEIEFLKKYRILDNHGKESIDIILEREAERVEVITRLQHQFPGQIETADTNRKLHLYTYLRKIACAENGFYFDDIPTEMIEAPYIRNADFIIRVDETAWSLFIITESVSIFKRLVN